MSTKQNQPSLFDFQGPKTRHDHPETSHVAEKKKNQGDASEIGSADSDRERIYNVIRLRPGLTSGEIARHFMQCYPNEAFWDNNRVGRRTPELKAAGRIASFGSKICELKKSLMQVYVVARHPDGKPSCCASPLNHVWNVLPGTGRETGQCLMCATVLGTRRVSENAVGDVFTAEGAESAEGEKA